MHIQDDITSNIHKNIPTATSDYDLFLQIKGVKNLNKLKRETASNKYAPMSTEASQLRSCASPECSHRALLWMII